ncbi:hypothetical protein DVR12_05160 [Chitinophaga silvatica]|uniref:Uncharacterized protein n=1 Tax=Chitinophaga silvatica TaxID=2282649 RepID=A0A3E1YDI4_9BACT|nr:hypothetical protein [Chitinophaga silvatica]RFS24596.1 hypothetical protein DVR12_05160 [Chitinophaga silvatica]
MYRRNPGRKAAHIAKFIVLGLVFITVVGLVTMSLWNCLIPELFHGPVISFWQALGLLLLGKLLFGWHGGPGGPKGRAWKNKFRDRMENMSEEERERMKEAFKNRCKSGFNAFAEEFCKKDEPNKPADTSKDQPTL